MNKIAAQSHNWFVWYWHGKSHRKCMRYCSLKPEKFENYTFKHTATHTPPGDHEINQYSEPPQIPTPKSVTDCLSSSYFQYFVVYCLLTVKFNCRANNRVECLSLMLTTRCVIYHGPLTRYVRLCVAHAPGMPGTFSPTADFKGNR